MKKKTLSMAILSIVLISGMFSAMVNVESPDEIAYVDIGVEEAVQLLISSQDVTILDVRTRAEYESVHIAGAESIPLSELEERIDELDRNETIIVYCKSGVRSENASNVLVNQRFRNAYNMLGGINAWTDAGFPVVSNSYVHSFNDDIWNLSKPVFLILHANWCSFCQKQMPIIDELEIEYKNEIVFVRLNGEEHQEIMKEFGANGYPSMFLITGKGEDGEYDYQCLGGFKDKETLKESVDQIINITNSYDHDADEIAGAASAPLEASSCPSSPPGVAPKDPGILSGALCRDACGADCPSTCITTPVISICVSDSELCRYETIECGTHEGCRVHDACYDVCAYLGKGSPEWFLCQRVCDVNCILAYNLTWCDSWRIGGGPFDGWLKFSDPPELITCVKPKPYCVDGESARCVQCRTYTDCDDRDGCYPYGNGCEDRDYSCSDDYSCTYTYSNRHTDYYDDWVYYCKGDEVWRKRLFHDFYCGGTCTDHTDWVHQLWEVCGAGETCVGGTCQEEEPPPVPEFPLGVEATVGIGLMIAVVYMLWGNKQKKINRTKSRRYE